MTLIDALVRLRDDIKTWVTNNLNILDRAVAQNKSKAESHAADTDIHVTPEERTLWGNKSSFSGDYNDLDNAPGIVDDESGSLQIADKAGNVVLCVDGTGLEATEVRAKRLLVDGADVADLGFSGEYSDLSNAPKIVDDESGELLVTDAEGHKILQVDQDGVATTKVTTKQVVADGVDLGVAVSALDESVVSIQELVGDTSVAEQIKRAVVDTDPFSGSYNDLTDTPSITDDGSADLVVSDSVGRTVFRVDKDGVETTRVVAGGVDLGKTIKDLAFDTDETLTLENGVLGVNVATEVGDQTLPVTAAAVNTAVGNIETILATI